MAGKLKIIRVLANPIAKGKKKTKRKTKSAKVKRRKGTRQRAVRSVTGKWIVRQIHGRTAWWWTGSAWAINRTRAKVFASANAAARATKAARKKAAPGWVVIDVMPA